MAVSVLSKIRDVCTLLVPFLVVVTGTAATPATEGRAEAPHLGSAVSAATPTVLFRSAILEAIRADLDLRGIPQSLSMRPEDLRIQLAAPVPVEGAGLQVKSIEFDSIRHETIFQIWTSKQPQFLPFLVTTRWEPSTPRLVPGDDGAAGLAAWVPPSTSLSGVSPSIPVRPSKGFVGTRVRPTIFVKPGRPATLIILGHNFRISMSVVPLETGSAGQHIRVRDTASARVFSADVIAEGFLQTSY